jgi:glycosyltransferase involved in cell wall biosynthesis
VHSYSFYTNFAAFLAARAAGCVGVGSVRGEVDLPNMLGKRPVVGRLSASLPRFQISNSYAAARNTGWFRPKELRVVSNGLDMARFRSAPVPLSQPPILLGIGTLDSNKRWDRLIQVAGDLHNRNVSCEVHIAGDGPLRSDLEALAVRLGIASKTRFLGRRDDIPDLIAHARVVVHTSDREGTPNAIMEAMASGRPVVATDVGDVSRLIQNNVNGFVVHRGDQAELFNRVLQVLMDDSLATRFGNAARQFAQTQFGLSSLVEETFDVYRAAGWSA